MKAAYPILAMAAFVCAASRAPAIGRGDTTEEFKARLQANADKLSRLGGVVEKPGNGAFGFVSAQKTYSRAELDELAQLFSGQLHFQISVSEAVGPVTATNALETLSKGGFSVALFFVDDKDLPISLAAIEERWALINASKVAEGAKDASLRRKRLQREISRMVKAIFLNGSAVRDVRAPRAASDLELINADPIDGQQLFTIVRSMPSYGLVAPRLVPYSKACQEGWAPAPTNDIQKAIWEETRKLPEKPIKIEFDPKKGK